jgi:HEAT repeat protein
VRRIVLVGLVLVLAAALNWFGATRKAAQPPAPTGPAEASQAADSTAPSSNGDAPAARSDAGVPTTTPPASARANVPPATADAEIAPATHEEYVAKRISALQDLGMENDSDSLNSILNELDNEDPEIRQGAVEAAVQFGSRDAIPRLMDAADKTSDPKEKAAILEAVEYLNTPTLAEALTQTNNAARATSAGVR